MTSEQLEKVKHMRCKLMDMLCDLDDALEEESKSGSVSLVTIKAVSKVLASIHYIEEMQEIHDTREEDAEIAVSIAAVKAAGVAANEHCCDSTGDKDKETKDHTAASKRIVVSR
ncbi:MAG: hypothetical protein J6Y02_04715 [Pseudobutyrivibrio sp.]|nr:hypothetical protein [Pseudobutyrivibrio sp.]